MAVAADAAEADALVSSLESLEMDEVVAETPSDLAEYGLAAPRATVRVRLQGAGEPLVLQVGDKTPDGSAVYARVPTAARVFTVPAYVEASFTKKPFDLRDRSVLHVQREEVTALDIKGPEGAYALAKDDEGRMVLRPPARAPAPDAGPSTRWWARWRTSAWRRWPPRPPPTSGRSASCRPPAPSPSAWPEVPRGPSRSATARREGRHHVHVAGSPLVAIVPGALVGDLAKGMGELRAKRLLEISTYEVEGFDVEAGGTKRVHARTSSKDEQGADVHKWKRTAPDAKDLDTNKVQDALFAVGGLEVLEFIDAPKPPDAYGLDAPVLRVTLRHAGGRPPAWFEVGTKDGAVLRPAGRRRRRDEARPRKGGRAGQGVRGAIAPDGLAERAQSTNLRPRISELPLLPRRQLVPNRLEARDGFWIVSLPEGHEGFLSRHPVPLRLSTLPVLPQPLLGLRLELRPHGEVASQDSSAKRVEQVRGPVQLPIEFIDGQNRPSGKSDRRIVEVVEDDAEAEFGPAHSPDVAPRRNGNGHLGEVACPKRHSHPA